MRFIGLSCTVCALVALQIHKMKHCLCMLSKEQRGLHYQQLLRIALELKVFAGISLLKYVEFLASI